LFAIAAPGLEPIVARELRSLGERPRIDEGGVSWEGDARSMMRANLWLRTASRVLLRVARFRATAFYELEQRAKRVPWHEFVQPGRAVEFHVTARKSKLYHSDAIAERLQKAAGSGPLATGRRPELKAESSQLFVVRVLHDDFTISADTSGALLHMRGYRLAIGKAPIRETLGAALLMAAGWDGETALLDPFCGSGTIPIEAAMIARNVAPGLRRGFAFLDWPAHYDPAWRVVLKDAKSQIRQSPRVGIVASDRDAGVVDSARANADRAGVGDALTLSVRAVSSIEPTDGAGLVATNPPYGKRASEGADVRNVYAQMGKVLRARFVGWRLALYSPDDRLSRQTGLELTELFRTSNGGLKVSALGGEIGTNPVDRR
jgi:putative N6-adenine-specific DNA methylase